jgi:hypothetical protein
VALPHKKRSGSIPSVRSIAIGLVLLFALPAQASRVERARLQDLVTGADLVVLGSAISAQSYLSGGRILTRVTITVGEVWSGVTPESPTIDVVTLGGVVGDIGQLVSGEAAIPVGSQVVLFLVRQGDVLRVLGLSQGLFRVVAVPGAPARIERRMQGLEWAGDGPSEALPDRLDGLKARVLELRHAP